MGRILTNIVWMVKAMLVGSIILQTILLVLKLEAGTDTDTDTGVVALLDVGDGDVEATKEIVS